MNHRIKIAWAVLAITLILGLAGCSKSLPVSQTPSNDPAGLGTPQQRLEALKANTMMDPRLKARKMRILEGEINGTNAAPGKG